MLRQKLADGTHSLGVLAALQIIFSAIAASPGNAQDSVWLACEFVDCVAVDSPPWDCASAALRTKIFSFEPKNISGKSGNGDEYVNNYSEIISIACDERLCSINRLDRFSGFLYETAFGNLQLGKNRGPLTKSDIYSMSKYGQTRYTYKCSAATQKF
ncbi:hypothetical protein EYE42_03935 [Paracoccus subflavus]|uniref:Uncharacterized protein n=1 Tax=Paracoccus subflavus TaxID=2528244 RepID=A0A4Q9G3K6_9RHOB|nr:hypothetical protein [Paracoccus subflavus]TBN42585.1 hypothetical protein EYE42_03935 [Paracoccus subflavus]